ncbi:MAG: tRNA threonylcarbamoyladenosine dehydratase, partial [Parafannyhessea umbonata]|nr:tRNA threonylcarbamoyladenosine dehydratase [Parafannyhessea umbonata]
LRFSTIEKTKSCPICKVMRKECRKRGIRGLQVLYSSEVPMPVTPRGAELPGGRRPEKGVTLGTMSYMPPIMGQMIAGRVICDLADLHNDLDVQEPIVASRRRGGR